jgi:hypothetical protein
MDKETRILLLSLAGIGAAAIATLAVKHKHRPDFDDGDVVISRGDDDKPQAHPDKRDLYDDTPVTFQTDPEDPDLDWVIIITDKKGTPFKHKNGNDQAVFTPQNNQSRITAKHPPHGQKDDYKYTIYFPKYGTLYDPNIIIH